MMSLKAFVVVFIAVIGMVRGFHLGAPNFSCRNQIPGHSNGTQPDPAPYEVRVTQSVIRPGGTTSVILESTDDYPFKGFLCAVSDMYDNDNNAVGTMSFSTQSSELFSTSPPVIELKTVNCSRALPYTGITHTNNTDKYRVEFEWTAPADAMIGQQYKLRCTTVFTFLRCWTNLMANITIGTQGTTSTRASGTTTGGSGTDSTAQSTTAGGRSSSNNNNNNNNNGSPGVSGRNTQDTITFQPTTGRGNFNPFTTAGNNMNNNAGMFGPNTGRPNSIGNLLFGDNPSNDNFGNMFNRSPRPLLGNAQDSLGLMGNQNRGSGAFNSLNQPTDLNRPSTLIPNRNQPNLGASVNPARGVNDINRNNNIDPRFTNNDAGNPNLVDRNLVRPNEQFVDTNSISDFAFRFPSAFFLTPSAIRRFRERNIMLLNTQNLNMF